MSSLHDFVLYVWDFYGSEGLYPIEGLQKQHIFDAFNVYIERVKTSSYMSWGGGDSLDRERVRDIILELQLNKMEVV